MQAVYQIGLTGVFGWSQDFVGGLEGSRKCSRGCFGWSGVLSLGSLISGLGDDLLGGHSDNPGSGVGVGGVGLVCLFILFFQCNSSKQYLYPSPNSFVLLTIMQVKRASRISYSPKGPEILVLIN